MALKTILNVMKKWYLVFVIAALVISAFAVIQNTQAFHEDECSYYGDCYDDCEYYGDCYDDCDNDCYDDCNDDCYDDCNDDCNPPPKPTPIDVCPNLAGVQTTLPSGLVFGAGGNCVAPTPTLYVQCAASSYNVKVDQDFTMQANIAGGNGSYTYKWTGGSGLTGKTTQKVTHNYGSEGEKTPYVTVTSGNQTVKATCNINVTLVKVVPVCVANKTIVKVGEEVRYTVSATGGTGSYTYAWSGSAPINGKTGSVQNISYTTTGTKTASVTATSGSKSGTDACPTVVVEETPQVGLVCQVNKLSANIGESVQYLAIYANVTGPSTFTWSGSAPINGRTGPNQSVVYTTAGTKTATVTVTANGQTRTATCQNVVVEEPTPDLNVICEVNRTQINKGESVRYTASATGGTGSYSYTWSGSSPLNGRTGSSQDVTYTTTGTKTGTVTVTSGGQSDTATCNNVVVSEPTQDLNVICEVNKTSITKGEEVRYIASATGGTGSYSYTWSGSSPINGRTGSSQYVTYTTAGTKNATVTVTSGSYSDTATCNNVVVSEPTQNLNVVCEVDRTRVQKGDEVEYRASATGGAGSYSYTWSGSSPINGRTGATQNISYSTTGTKTATVTVRSGNYSDTASCQNVVVEQEVQDLNVICEVNRTQVQKGDEVEYRASATGGTGSYSYTWSGSSPINGRTGSAQDVTYTTTGTKTASVTVRSGNYSDTATCQNVVVEEETQDLNVVCTVNKTHIEKGEEVRYTASATGGTGSYSYTWSGSSPLNGRTGSSQYVTYTSTGSKSASVTVRSGNDSDTANCSTVVVEEEENDEDLDVVCEVSRTRIDEGESVKYTAKATGGTGSYSYEWSGSSPLDGEEDRVVTVRYNSEGRKTATVEVRSGNDRETARCNDVTVEEEEDDNNDDLDVSCDASPSTVYVNQTVTWSSDVDGGSGSKKYSWSGSNDLSGKNSTVYKSYSTPGTKTARVTVTSGGDSESDECSITVLAAADVTVYQNPSQGTLASLSSVYLSQVPYTGPEDMKYLGYILSLLLASAFGTYYVVKHKAKMTRKGIINAFKQSNLARKINN